MLIQIIEYLCTINQHTLTMKTITSEQGQQIIDIACPTWQERLANEWGKDIVCKRLIEISDNDYRTMRLACTKEQNEIFDQIFGRDEHSFNVGDYFTVVKESYGLNGKLGQTYKIIRISGDSLYYEEYNSVCSRRVKVRPATPEEIRNYTIPKGTPCFVRNHQNDFWRLAYADGDGKFSCKSDLSEAKRFDWEHIYPANDGFPKD